MCNKKYIIQKIKKNNKKSFKSIFVDEKDLTKYKYQNKMRKKRGDKKIKIKSTKKIIPIDEFLEKGIIKTKNKYIKILKVNPINFNLKSNLEKESILNSYKIFLKTCNFDIQILIQSKKEDLSQNISNIKNNIKKEENNFIKKYSEEYIEFINKINNEKKSSSKNFYIIINYLNLNKNTEKNKEIIIQNLNEKYFKIKECLLRCGNYITETTKEECIEILYSFLNTEKYLNKLNLKNK